MMYQISVSKAEIDEVLNQVTDAEDEGSSKWPGMTYEQGVKAAIEWLIGQTDVAPMDD